MSAAPSIQQRRQFHELDDGEVADLAEALVAGLRVELRWRGVAGAQRAGEWDLAQQVRDAVQRHHREAVRRARHQEATA